MSYTLGMDRRCFFKRAGQIIAGGIAALLIRPVTKAPIAIGVDKAQGQDRTCSYISTSPGAVNWVTNGGIGNGSLLDTSTVYFKAQAKEAQRLIDNNIMKGLHKG